MRGWVPERTDFDRPQRLRPVDYRRGIIRKERGKDCGLFARAAVGAGQPVITSAPGSAVAQEAAGAVIEKQCKGQRNRVLLHRRERIGVGHATEQLFPGVVETQQGSRYGRPTDVCAGCASLDFSSKVMAVER
jgi:hypothetical protein